MARDVLAARWAALEGRPLRLVELSAEAGGLDLLIYDQAGELVGVSYVPAALAEQAEEAAPAQ